MGKRETTKAVLRERMIDAVVDLSNEAGFDGFNMRELAKRAGVSQATPFNLFGSKAELLSQIFSNDLASFRAMLKAAAPMDNLQVLFEIGRLSQTILSKRQALYRSLYISFHDIGGEPVRRRLMASVLEFFVKLIHELQEEEIIRRSFPATLIAYSFYLQWDGAVSAWAHGDILLEQLEGHACFGFATLLLGVAEPREHARILQLQTASQERALRGRSSE